MKELPSKYLEKKQLWVYHPFSITLYPKAPKAKKLTHLAEKLVVVWLLIVFILLSEIIQLFFLQLY